MIAPQPPSKRPRKDPLPLSIGDFFNGKVDDASQKHLNDGELNHLKYLVVNFIIFHNFPFSIVESEYFKQLVLFNG